VLEFLLLIGMITLTIWGFMNNILLGFVLLIAILLYYYFKRYATFCIMLAMRSYGNGQIVKSFHWFERAEKRGMSIPQKITYAYYLLREGRVERSEAVLNGILAFPMKPALKYQAKSTHALMLLKTGRIMEAQEELEEIFPNFKNTTIYGNLGYVYILTGKLDKAEAFNQEAYDFNKDDTVILDNMVQLYTKLSDYEKAWQYAEELMAKKPTFAEAYYDAAVVAKNLGKTEEAKGYLEHALTIRISFMSGVSHEEIQSLLDSLS